MYSTSTPYTEIKSVRAALTSFAVQVVHRRLVSEAKQAVKPSSSLHASAKKKGRQQVEWLDIGEVGQTIRKHWQPLTWYYMMSLLNQKVEQAASVITHTILSLNFARNNEARLLPLARGLLYFAFFAPVTVLEHSMLI